MLYACTPFDHHPSARAPVPIPPARPPTKPRASLTHAHAATHCVRAPAPVPTAGPPNAPGARASDAHALRNIPAPPPHAHRRRAALNAHQPCPTCPAPHAHRLPHAHRPSHSCPACSSTLAHSCPAYPSTLANHPAYPSTLALIRQTARLPSRSQTPLSSGPLPMGGRTVRIQASPPTRRTHAHRAPCA